LTVLSPTVGSLSGAERLAGFRTVRLLGRSLFHCVMAASLGCSLGYVLGAIMRTGKQADIIEQNL
jgi:NhaP-type Na+/H+ or K+/H+ antiporter